MLQMGKKYSKSNLTPIFVRSDLNFDNQVNEEDYEILKDLINFDWDLNGDLVIDSKDLRSFIDGVKGNWAENSFQPVMLSGRNMECVAFGGILLLFFTLILFLMR
jgi:hypothetical protein